MRQATSVLARRVGLPSRKGASASFTICWTQPAVRFSHSSRGRNMTEPRRSTRARAREEAAAPAPETPSDKAAKGSKATLKRKRTNTAAAKDSTPGTPVGDSAPQGSRPTLPLRIAEGQPLPTLPAPQPLDLPAGEWQNIQQSGVLSASLQRSRAVWVSGVNFRTFHKKHTMPKKLADRTEADKAARARQKEVEKNFPQVGARDAQLVIEPHTFPIKLYAPKEGSRPPPKKMPPPPQYGQWPNHSQHPPHPHHTAHPPPHPHPHHPYAHHQPQPRPPPPKPVQHPPPQSAPPPASTPAPDPVIHMLAARAGTDPELKAVMKIVAAGHATKAQLEFFQTHINELTEILEKNKKAKGPVSTPANAAAPSPALSKPSPAVPKQSPAPPKQSPAPPNPAPAPPNPSSAPPNPPTAPPTPSPAPPKQSPAPTPPPPRPAPPAQQQPPPKPASTPTAPKPFSPAPPHTQYAPSPQSRPPQPNPYPPKNYSHPPHYQQPPPHYAAPPPPRITYRPLTFEFVEGNGDRFYFPSYSFMEWLPNGSGAKFSFLVTKLKPKPEESAKPPSTPSTPAPPQTPAPADASTPGTANPPFPPTPGGPTATPTPVPAPSYVAPPRIEDFDERNDIQDVAFYQPVTVLVLTDEHDVKNALPRAIRPPSVVDKYMEQVFDSCKRADETYLAFRLPRDRTSEPDAPVRSAEATPARATPAADKAVGAAGAGAEKRRSVAGRRKGLV